MLVKPLSAYALGPAFGSPTPTNLCYNESTEGLGEREGDPRGLLANQAGQYKMLHVKNTRQRVKEGT